MSGRVRRQIEKRKIIFLFLFLQLSYSVILHVESHCSTIANFFFFFGSSLHLQFRMLSSFRSEKENNILFLFLQLSYSVILHVESHCSTIANFFFFFW